MTFTYLETFAGSGVGGMALDSVGGKCIGYSEVDKFAIKNYDENFPNRINFGDITEINTNNLSQFDLLIGGTPCQNISIMRRQESSQEGLKGNESKLFFEFVRILNDKLPKWFIFENVRKLLTSNDGEDFETVKELLGEHYNIKWEVMNTSDHGVPQTRRRIYIVGQRKNLGSFEFKFPQGEELKIFAQDLLDQQVDDKYYLTEKMTKTVLSRGTGGWDADPETDMKIARPLCATLFKMHRASQDNYYHTEYKPEGKTNLRRLTPRECARLQGILDTYKIVVSDTQAYKLMGNAMSLNVVKKIADQLFN